MNEEELERKIIETVLEWQKDKDIAMSKEESPSKWTAAERRRVAEGRLFAYAEMLHMLRAAKSVKR